MKKVLAITMAVVMIFSFTACSEKEASCNHEYVATVETKDDASTVVLTCKNCGDVASADVKLPEKTVEVPVEKEVEKVVTKEVVKEVVKEVQVPVYATLEERMMAEDYEALSYYIENYSKLDAIKNYILESYYTEIDDETLMQGAYDGMVGALGDPYSEYVPADDAEEYYDSLTQSYSGIGVTIGVDADGNPKIESVTVDSPAKAAGLKKGDVILVVDGHSCLGIGLDAAQYIRGEVGTTVNITVLRDGSHINFTVTRQKLGMPTVDYGVLEGGQGYIAISGFDSVTNAELKAALADLSKQGVTKFVLDLRDNGGGDVDVAIQVADQLMNAGVVCYIEDQQGNKDYYKTVDGRTSMKYVVLVNDGTASAAEIITAGIQDNNEAKIVGTTTYGKGVIQILAYINDGSSIKLTQYQYFSPKGKAINKVGIKPDYVVDLTADCYDSNGNLVKDAQLEKALELLK